MSEKLADIQVLAAKLMASSTPAVMCPKCLGSGYVWAAIFEYWLPFLCDCDDRNRVIVTAEHATVRSLSPDSKKEVYEEQDQAVSVKIADALGAFRSYSTEASKIKSIIELKAARDAILGYNIDEESVQDAILLAVSKASDGALDDEAHAAIRKLLKQEES